MKKACCMVALCFISGGAARAQTGTSPQGGAAIYNGAAVCSSNPFHPVASVLARFLFLSLPLDAACPRFLPGRGSRH
jgi:hypothetical protein